MFPLLVDSKKNLRLHTSKFVNVAFNKIRSLRRLRLFRECTPTSIEHHTSHFLVYVFPPLRPRPRNGAVAVVAVDVSEKRRMVHFSWRRAKILIARLGCPSVCIGSWQKQPCLRSKGKTHSTVVRRTIYVCNRRRKFQT